MKTKTILLSLITFHCSLSVSVAQVTPHSQMEKLDRGLVAMPTSMLGTTNFVSWRLLGTDVKSRTTFDLLRDGEVVATGLTKTNYQDSQASTTSVYQVVTRVDGEVVETSNGVKPWPKKFLTLQLQRPEGGIHASWKGEHNVPYSYVPNDMSVGDVDGDGQYELILKWNSTHDQDNSESYGYTGNTFIDCYRIDPSKDDNCELLWRIDLGPNIRGGAHYTQFMVYDFNCDGKAEMMCKTATGSKDGLGNYVNQAATDAAILAHPNSKDYRNSSGHVLEGPEYLTVFDGLTGRAIHTTWYLPGRTGTGAKLPSGTSATEGGSDLGKVMPYPAKEFWGDNYGNRSERFLASVAYLNGADQPASAVFCRGYYTRAYVWAVSFDGERLHTEWLHASPSNTQSLVFTSKTDDTKTWPKVTVDGDVLQRTPIKTASRNTMGISYNGSGYGSNTLFGNGNHNMSVADVDGDGCDEILWGSAALDHDGTLLYATGFGHGDAIHVGKMIPDSADLYVFEVHEDKLPAEYGSWDLHNARTGRIIWHGGSADKDNGRGMAADLTGKNGYEFWSGDERNPRNATTGKSVISKNCSVNFRIYWDGSYADQLFDGSHASNADHSEPYIQKWNGSSFSNSISFYNSTYNYAQSCNYTKSTPCLQADILGDWREELVMWNKRDSSQVMVFSTLTPTTYAVPTLMHDHVYRMGITWQNSAYNQPPHLGYYLPDYIEGKIPEEASGIVTIKQDASTGKRYYDLLGRRLPDNTNRRHGFIIER